ncbi:hypothetical protein ACVWYH_005718 [Bradyrhizobium sp. GM24.11]
MGIDDLCLIAVAICDRLIKLCLVRAWVDLGEYVAFLDGLALL